MRSKRSREESQANLDVSTSLRDRDMLRSVSTVDASNNISESLNDTAAQRAGLNIPNAALLDSFSTRLVTVLHGSADFSEAESRCREVLADFQHQVEAETSEKLERHVSANRVLVKALNVLRQENVEDLKQRLALAEDRAAKSEHTVEVLRWHLQNNSRPPNII